MRTSSPLNRVVLVLTCLGLLLQQLPASAAERPSPPATRLGDVELGPQGTLHGTVLDPQGIAVPDARVIVMSGRDRVADTKTDEHGRFAVSKLRPGVHLVAAVGSAKTYRFWTPGAAPPAATPGVMLVSNDAAYRAQGDWYAWIADHYILFCCAVAAAIAIPCALIDANDHHEPASP